MCPGCPKLRFDLQRLSEQTRQTGQSPKISLNLCKSPNPLKKHWKQELALGKGFCRATFWVKFAFLEGGGSRGEVFLAKLGAKFLAKFCWDIHRAKNSHFIQYSMSGISLEKQQFGTIFPSSLPIPNLPSNFCLLLLGGQKRHISIWHMNNFSVTPVTDPPGRAPERKYLCSLGSAHST